MAEQFVRAVDEMNVQGWAPFSP